MHPAFNEQNTALSRRTKRLNSMNPSTNEMNANRDVSRQRRSKFLQTALAWHWISSALALTGMLLFTVTGFTLNHAEDITASPETTVIETQLPAAISASLVAGATQSPQVLPTQFTKWLTRNHDLSVSRGELEWSESELYLSLTKAGGDAWLAVDLPTGQLTYESTDRGWIAYFNDLHKGRHTGVAWRWFIDLFALVCLTFCLTGFVVLWLHSRERLTVWPITGLGILVPTLLALLFIH